MWVWLLTWSLVGWRFHTRGVLENAFWTGVMNKLSPGDEALAHLYFAPGAEAIRKG